MNTNETMSHVEINKAVIQRYFEAYNNRNVAIFDEIIDPNYVDQDQSAYTGAPGMGVAGAKYELENSCGPIGPGSDIASKSGFFASLFEWEPREDDFRTNRSW